MKENAQWPTWKESRQLFWKNTQCLPTLSTTLITRLKRVPTSKEMSLNSSASTHPHEEESRQWGQIGTTAFNIDFTKWKDRTQSRTQSHKQSHTHKHAHDKKVEKEKTNRNIIQKPERLPASAVETEPSPRCTTHHRRTGWHGQFGGPDKPQTRSQGSQF